MKKIYLTILAIFLASIATINAAQFPWAGWENKEVKVLSVQIDMYNVVMVALQNPTDVGTTGGIRYYKLGMAADAALKTKMSILLVAQTNGVNIIIPDSDWTAPTMSDIPELYIVNRICSK